MNYLEIRAWVSNYIPQKAMTVITYPCHYILAYLFQVFESDIGVGFEQDFHGSYVAMFGCIK